MHTDVYALISYMREKAAADDGQSASPLDLLWRNYSRRQIVCSGGLSKTMAALDSITGPLTDRQEIDLLSAVAGMCIEHERLAFAVGVRAGVRLAGELA